MFTRFIWNHKIKFSILAFIITWYIYHGHYSDQAIKYKNFEKIEIGMDTNQVKERLGRPELITYHVEDSSYTYRFSKDAGFLTEMSIEFNLKGFVINKWVK